MLRQHLHGAFHNMQSDLEASVIDLKHLTDNLPISRRTERRELPTVIIDRRRLVRLSEVRAWRPGRLYHTQCITIV